MNTLILILLLAYLVFLFWFVRYRYLPRIAKIQPDAFKNSRFTLACNTYKVLGLIHWVLFVLVMIWVPVAIILLVMTSSAGPGHTPGDITIYANLHIDLAALPDVTVSGLRQEALSTSTELDLTAPNLINFFLFAVTGLIKLILTLFVILQMRNALASFCNGESFKAGNSKRLKEIGMVVTFAYLVGPFWQWFLSASVIKAITFSSDAITLTPSTSSSWLGLFVGVGLIILSGVIRDAEQMQQEQGLTI